MEKYYGILTTYNPFTKKWYAFDNGSVADFFSFPEKVMYGEGNNASDAMKNYIIKKDD